MADIPSTIDTAAAIDNLNKLDAATKTATQSLNFAAAEANLAQTSFNLFGSAANNAGNFLSGFQTKLEGFGQSMKQSSSLTSEQTKQFGLLNVMMIGARQQFEGLANVDFSAMTTFGEQIEFIRDTVGDSATAIGKLSSLASSMGQALPDAFKGSIDMASKFVMGLARSADNTVKLRTAFIQLASQTGELGQVYQASGSHLENLNSIVAKQQQMIVDTAQATGMSSAQVEKYYSQLAAIPKAMSETVAGGKKGSETISLLTGVMQFAAGSGRKYSEVIDDLHESFRDFRLSGQDALNFSSRMTELTSRFSDLGIEFKDVRSGLMGMSKEFKDITNAGESASKMTENMSQIMGEYIGALTKSGTTSAHAIDIIHSMTGAISGLKIEQKAFLSAQTGGPGGLMGAFQIDKMMKDGDIKGVMEKVQAQMKKQLGSIVTLDDATQSQGAASQLMKQVSILRSGPLGQFAKTDQDAYRLLEAFKKKDEGGKFTLDDSAVVTTMDRGVEIQQKTFTEISRMRGLMESSRANANIASAEILETGFAASSGANKNNVDPNLETRRNLQSSMTQNAIRSGKDTQENSRQLNSGKVVDGSGEMVTRTVEDSKRFFSDLPRALSSNVSSVFQSIFGESFSKASDENQLKADIERRKQEATNSRMKNVSNDEINSKRQVTIALPVREATTSSIKRNEEKKETKVVVETTPQKVNVHVTGFCIRCKNDMEGSNQMLSNSPAAGNR
jgi:hypothetical protein